MLRGTVKWFNEKKGYGFITRDDGSGDLFVHFTEIKGDKFRTLNEGDHVEFEEAPGRDGRLQAVKVVVVG